MNLKELIAGADAIDSRLTAFAKKIDGRFRPESAVVLLFQDDGDDIPPLDRFIAENCPGFDYFLEVDLIQQLLRTPPGNLGGQSITDTVIGYAVYDA